jgi:acyl-CoA synthetase (AMP-forming)/AMP-acid ligase II
MFDSTAFSPSHTLPALVRSTAARQPEAAAVIGPDRAWSWGTLAALVERTAAVLRSSGVEGGDRIVLVSENSPTTLVLLLATQCIRAWPAVINARLPHMEVQSLIDCAQPRLVLFALDDSASVAAHADQLGATPLQVEGLGHVHQLRLDPAIAPQPPAACPADDVGVLIFTSGTTGQPKAVMISHAGLLNCGSVTGRARGTREGDVVDVAAPLAHIMGLTSVLVAWTHGVALRIRPRLAPAELVQAIARGEVTQASMVPAGWLRLLEQIEQEGIELSQHRLRTLVSGGAPLDPQLRSRIERTFGQPVQNAYGMTECAPLARTLPGRPAQPWSVGRPEANVEVRIVDAQGHPVAGGDIGEIQARGPGVMMGYFANPVATREALREEGWFATGDLGRWLPDGDLAVVGRKKEMIIRSGFNVYPAEVEAAISAHPAVLYAAVIGEPAALGDEAVVAYVQLRAGQVPGQEMARALEATVRNRLAPYKCPSRFEFVEHMPLGATGKILKRALGSR